MKRFAVIAVLLVASLSTPGAVVAQGEGWEASLTPRLMERVESVLSLDGKATPAQYSIRAQVLVLWLAGNAQQLKGNPAKTLEAGLAALAGVSDAQGNLTIEAGSGTGNVPPCIAGHQAEMDRCSYLPGGYEKQNCLRDALTNYLRCMIIEGCSNYVSGWQLLMDNKACPYVVAGPSCKKTTSDVFTIPVQNNRWGFHLTINNYANQYVPNQAIGVTVKVGGQVVAGPFLVLDGQSASTHFTDSVPGNPAVNNGTQLSQREVSVEVNMCPPLNDGKNDYWWNYSLQCAY